MSLTCEKHKPGFTYKLQKNRVVKPKLVYLSSTDIISFTAIDLQSRLRLQYSDGSCGVSQIASMTVYIGRNSILLSY